MALYVLSLHHLMHKQQLQLILVIGGILAALPSGINAKQIGNGIYFFSSSSFTINVVENDLMRVMQSSVNDVQSLPNQCKNGYIVRVSNALEQKKMTTT